MYFNVFFFLLCAFGLLCLISLLSNLIGVPPEWIRNAHIIQQPQVVQSRFFTIRLRTATWQRDPFFHKKNGYPRRKNPKRRPKDNPVRGAIYFIVTDPHFLWQSIRRINDLLRVFANNFTFFSPLCATADTAPRAVLLPHAKFVLIIYIGHLSTQLTKRGGGEGEAVKSSL